EGNNGTPRPGLGPGVPTYTTDQPLTNWFNAAACAVPAKGTWGDLGRNVARGPGFWEVDSALEKTTPVGGKMNVKVRAEACNLFNRPIFANPAANISAVSSFGRLTNVLNAR